MKFDVRFPSKGLMLAGHLYVPDTYDGSRLPGIVVSHPWGGVKEQTAGLYAERLSRQGFAAFAFDAANQGESEGEPRGVEDPFQRAEDIKSAVSHLAAREDIDPQRIGALGICASGGYVPFAAQTDRRIKAVATVSALDAADLYLNGLGRTNDPALASAMLDQAGVMRTAEARNEGVVYARTLPEREEETAGLPKHYYECWEYYRTARGFHPRSPNWWVPRSVEYFAMFDAYAHIERISPRPLLMIAGTQAETAYFSEEAIKKADEPKELFWIDGATHIDLYDKDEYVTPAVAKLTEFFGEHLAA
jgi:fermentation-respiration switch protein FrsA (DUF1100 family)